MSTLREVAQQALNFFSSPNWGMTPYMDVRVYEDAAKLRDDLRAALAQEEQPNRAQQMRDAGYARRPTLREMVEQEREAIAQNLQSRLDAALLLEERRQEIAQPHREWKGLSDTEVLSIHQSLCNTVGSDYRTVARAIEQALRSKNHE
jgi:hypothetical protein